MRGRDLPEAVRAYVRGEIRRWDLTMLLATLGLMILAAGVGYARGYRVGGDVASRFYVDLLAGCYDESERADP